MKELFDLATDLVNFKAQKKDAEDAVKAANESIKETGAKMLELMVEDEIQSFKMGGKTFFMNIRLFASIPDENKAAVIEWFKNNEDYSGLVKEAINANSLSAWVKERKEEEEQGILSVDEQVIINERLKVHEEVSVGVRNK